MIKKIVVCPQVAFLFYDSKALVHSEDETSHFLGMFGDMEVHLDWGLVIDKKGIEMSKEEIIELVGPIMKEVDLDRYSQPFKGYIENETLHLTIKTN